jgi:hypothetical protein
MLDHDGVLNTIVDMAKHKRLVTIVYRKGVTADKAPARLIEPHCFKEGTQDLMIRAFQMEPDDPPKCCGGWKFFMLHKIEDAQPTSISFRPRRTITLPGGEVEDGRPRVQWTEGRRAYRDLLGDIIADGIVADFEKREADELRAKYKLRAEDVRFVHAAVYSRCLAAVLDDDRFADEEVEQVRFLHSAMKSLGWGVGD